MEMKNCRANRPTPWPTIMLVAMVVALAAIVGPMDYADDLAREAELKVLRAELEALRKPRAELAPIRPHRACGNKTFVAAQPDGGRWIIRCVPEVKS